MIKEGFPVTLISDTMVGHVMRRKEVDLVLVGADRIAGNGDVANKIGTYQLAVLARTHALPFYVAAPTSTLDLTLKDGDEIPIEHRDIKEVTHFSGKPAAPEGVQVLNPAFDVTPHRYINAIFTERGVAEPPFEDSLCRL
jgi:methylthioribose-1-phosphate isomerase